MKRSLTRGKARSRQANPYLKAADPGECRSLGGFAAWGLVNTTCPAPASVSRRRGRRSRPHKSGPRDVPVPEPVQPQPRPSDKLSPRSATCSATTPRGARRGAARAGEPCQIDMVEVRRQHGEHAGQVLVAAAGEDQQPAARRLERETTSRASRPAPAPRRRCGRNRARRAAAGRRSPAGPASARRASPSATAPSRMCQALLTQLLDGGDGQGGVGGLMFADQPQLHATGQAPRQRRRPARAASARRPPSMRAGSCSKRKSTSQLAAAAHARSRQMRLDHVPGLGLARRR